MVCISVADADSAAEGKVGIGGTQDVSPVVRS